MELREILSRCDHTLLRVDATAAEIRALCDQGMRYAAQCVHPAVPCRRGRRNMSVTGCTSARSSASPNVQHSGRQAFEAAEAIRNGAERWTWS